MWIIDDVLARGSILTALANLAGRAGATVMGVGVVIGKTFDRGRHALASLGVAIMALAAVDARIEPWGDRPGGTDAREG